MVTGRIELHVCPAHFAARNYVSLQPQMHDVRKPCSQQSETLVVGRPHGWVAVGQSASCPAGCGSIVFAWGWRGLHASQVPLLRGGSRWSGSEDRILDERTLPRPGGD